MGGETFIAYLEDELRRRRIARPRYSMRSYAADLGIESATLSQLLSGKRKVTFAAARELLDRLDPALHVRNALLLSLDDPAQWADGAFEQRELAPEEMALLSRWEAYAVLAAVDLKDVEATAEGLARAVGAQPEVARQLLDAFVQRGVLAREGDRYRQTGVAVTSGARRSDALQAAHREWIERGLRALASDDPDADFSGITMAMSSARLAEAKRRIKEFRRSLAQYLAQDAGEDDVVVRLNLQFFPVRPLD
jgi:hypothetical protein